MLLESGLRHFRLVILRPSNLDIFRFPLQHVAKKILQTASSYLLRLARGGLGLAAGLRGLRAADERPAPRLRVAPALGARGRRSTRPILPGFFLFQAKRWNYDTMIYNVCQIVRGKTTNTWQKPARWRSRLPQVPSGCVFRPTVFRSHRFCGLCGATCCVSACVLMRECMKIPELTDTNSY